MTQTIVDKDKLFAAIDTLRSVVLDGTDYIPPVDLKPRVTITAPLHADTVLGPSITITAEASDDTAVTGVQFQLDGVDLGAEDTAAPYSITWDSTTVADGAHTITAIASDGDGNTRVSDPVVITVFNEVPDTAAPTVSISDPADGATVSGATVTISATAADNVGVEGVQFYLDGGLLQAEDTSDPFSITWDSTAADEGAHTLSAVARDAAGNVQIANTISITVLNVPVDVENPTVSITAPAAAATVAGTSVTVSADASDNFGVVAVQFKLDGADLGVEDFNAPYSISWDTTSAAEGSHTLTAVARDEAGNTATSAGVVVTVDNVTVDTTAPTITVTSPTALQTVSGTSFPFTVDVADNVGVTGVLFLVDGTPVTEVTAPPWQISLDSTAYGNGNHIFRANARDEAFNVGVSANVTASVNNAGADITAPTTPGSFDAAVFSNTQANLSWTASTDAVGVTGYQIHKGTQKIGYVGASISQYTILGATTLGFTRNWSDNLGYGGGGPYKWAQNLTNSNAYWAAFQAAYNANPTTNIWLQLCAIDTDAANETLANCILVVNQIKSRVPGATVYVSSQPDYVSAPCSIAGAGGPARMATLRDGLISGGHCLAGPVFADLLSSEVQGDGCHQDADGQATNGLAYINFFNSIGMTQVATTAALTYSDTGLTAGKYYSYAVKAYDAAGNMSALSTVDSVVMSTTTDTTNPTVSMTAPANGATVTGTSVTVSANASDAVGVVGVQFKIDGNNLGTEDLTAPYSIVWNTTTATNGAHSITAVARDAAGNSGTSSAISVTVDNTAPPVNTIGAQGIYVVDKGPTFATALAKSFVDGAIIRTAWKDIETTKGVYNFSALDSLLNTVTAAGKKATLIIFGLAPTWLVSEVKASPNNETTWRNGPLGNIEQPNPWSTVAQAYYHTFLTAAADHQVGGIALKNHTTIVNMLAPVMSMNDIRVAPTGYNLTTLTNTCVENVGAMITAFGTNKNYYFGLFPLTVVNDSVVIRDAILAAHPNCGVYQETWTGAGPSGTLASVLKTTPQTLKVKLQACGRWSNHSNPSGCNYATTDSPLIGYNTIAASLGARYLEIYDDDLNNASWAADFATIHDAIWAP